MQAAPTSAPPTASAPRYLKPIVIAGLLGGLLGGVASFSAARFIKEARPEAVPSAKEAATAEARGVVEGFLSILKARHIDEFWDHMKQAYTAMTDAEYKLAKDRFNNFLIEYDGRYSGSLGEFELLSETALSKDLIQYVYLERYARGAVIWRYVMYRGKDDRWYVAFLTWSPDTREAFLP